MSLREAAQQALEAMNLAASSHDVMLLSDPPQAAWKARGVSWKLSEAISALRAALAEPEQEPVAWELRMGKTDRVLMEITNNPERAQNWRASLCEVVPLYYAPTPRTWVGLTDAELAELSDAKLGSYDLCLEVEAKLKEKNT